MRKLLCFGFMFWLSPMISVGQSQQLPLHSEQYHQMYRLESALGQMDSNLFTTVKPLNRRDVAGFAHVFNSANVSISARDRLNQYYMIVDNIKYSPENAPDREAKPFLKHFFKNKTDLYKVDKGGLYVRINPLLHLETEVESPTNRINYRYSRGAQIQGIIDDKLAFYTDFSENVKQFPQYIMDLRDSTGRVKGVGFNTVNSNRAVDYFDANAHLNAQVTKHIDATFGHGTYFFGNGERSLLLSDNTPGYMHFKLRTRFKRFTYTNLFAQLKNVERVQGDGVRNSKYMSLHHFSVNITPNFNLGIFEAVMASREDNSFDLNYLNPVIFYRSLERYLGSPDNVMLGADFRWNFLKTAHVYGQFVLDEFKSSELFPNSGWWANKYAWQLGARYFNVFGIYNLDAQAEYNRARPFIYSHGNAGNGFHHYGLPVAHPLGANFTEWIGVIQYQPAVHWFLRFRGSLAKKGENQPGLNYGGDPLLSNRNRALERGNEVGQGELNEILTLSSRVSWRFHHNMYLDLNLTYRNQQAQAVEVYDNSIVGLGLRMNVW